MKRFVIVLAMMLILTLTAWNSAESMRGPRLEISDVNYDHPWGGDHNDPNPPSNYSVTPTTEEIMSFSGIIKNFNFRYLFNGSTFMFGGYRGAIVRSNTTTTTTTETNSTTTQTNTNNTTQTANGGGM